MELVSEDFEAGGEIPSAATCEGANQSPALSWSGVPRGAKSLALIIDDPDAPDPAAPKTIWSHWLLYNLPPATPSLAASGDPPATCRRARGRARTTSDAPATAAPVPRLAVTATSIACTPWTASCPTCITPAAPTCWPPLEGHVVAQAELVGTYQKHGR